MLDRRTFLGAMLVLPSIALAKGDSRITLPPPATEAGCDVLAAVKARRSTRAFARDPLPLQTLSTLLWVAFGINRPGAIAGRTAPASHQWYEIDVYAALPEGLYRYDASGHSLDGILEQDLRALTGTQHYVASAPLDLVYVADSTRMSGVSEEERTFYSAADAAVIAENVYLYCAAAGLATVVRGNIDRGKLAAAMKLRPEQRVVLAQSVGLPAVASLLK